MKKWVPVTGVLAKLRGSNMRKQVRSGTPAKEIGGRFSTTASTIIEAMRH